MLFISHSSRDEKVANDLLKRLLAAGYSADQVILDSDCDSGFLAGAEWQQELYVHLKGCQALLVLCSANWNESKWCFTEAVVATAEGKAIFPILLEPDALPRVLDSRQAVNVHVDGEAAYERLRKALDARHLGPQDSFGWSPVEGDDCPFPGLPAFDERYAGVYFGREPETQALLQQLRRMRANHEPRLLMIVGGSGSGKSSLLKAGVLPRLKHRTSDTEWLVLPTLRYGDTTDQQTIFDQLAMHLATRSALDFATLKRSFAADVKHASKAFVDAVQGLAVARGTPEATVLLPIDQFEELLAPRAGDIAARFLEFLKEVFGGANGRLLAIATMRSDYLDRYERHEHALTTPFFHTWHLSPFPRERIGDVIVRPAQRARVHIEPALVEALKRDTKDPEALPWLAFVLEKLYRKRRGKGRDQKLEMRDYEELGGIKGAIQKSADGLTAQLRPAVRNLLRTAFVKHLADINDDEEFVRMTARWSEMPDEVQPVLEEFVRERLLVKAEHREDGDGGGRWVSLEVAHEALFRDWPLLNEWLNESRDILRWRRDVERNRRPDQPVVLSDAQLAVAREWRHSRRDELTPEQLRWIDAAVFRERMRYGAIVLIVVLIAALAIVAWWQKRAADRAADASLGRSLAAQSATTLKNSGRMTEQSLLLAIEGYRRDRSPVTAAQLHTMLDLTPVPLKQFKHGKPVTVVRFSPSGNRIASADESGAVIVWDVVTGKELARTDRRQRVSGLVWRPDENQIAIEHDGDTAHNSNKPNEPLAQALLWDWKTGQAPVVVDGGDSVSLKSTHLPDAWLVSVNGTRLSRWTSSGEKHEIRIPELHGPVAVAESGRRLALTTEKEVIVLDPLTGDEQDRLPKEVGHPFELAVSPDGQSFGVSAQSGTSALWDSQSRTVSAQSSADSLAFSPDGYWIVGVSIRDTSLFVSSSDEGREFFRFDSPEEGFGSRGIRFANDGRYLVACLGDSTVRVFAVSPEGSVRLAFQFASGSELSDIDATRSGTRVAIGDKSGFVMVWTLETDASTTFPQIEGKVSPRGDVIALLGSNSRIVTASTGAPIKDLGCQTLSSSTAFSRDGQLIAAVCYERPDGKLIASPRIKVVDLSSKALRDVARDSEVAMVAFSSDGRVLVAEEDGLIVSLDLAANREERLAKLREAEGRFSPDGRFFAMKDFHKPTVLYRLDGKSKGRTIPSSPCPDIAFSDDGEYIACIYREQFVRVWRTDSLEKVIDQNLGDSTLRFDPSGRFLAASEESRIVLFDLQTKAVVRRFNHVGYDVSSLAFSSDGKHLAAFCKDRNVRVWRVSDGMLLTTVPQQNAGGSVHFAADDRYLLINQEDSIGEPYARRVKWQTDDVIREACGRVMRRPRGLSDDEWSQFAPGGPNRRETCAGY